MSTISNDFKEKVVQRMADMPEIYKITGIELGEDDVISTARIGCITGSSTTPELRFSCRGKLLNIEVRQIAFLGSQYSLTNQTVAGLFRDLIKLLVKKEELTQQDHTLHKLALEAFTGRQRTVWELMAMITMEMNNFHHATRSVVDFTDGEVYVDTAMECDFETVPTAIRERLQELAGHAKILEDILHIVRRKISEEPASADECFRETSMIVDLLKQNSDTKGVSGDSSGTHDDQGQGEDETVACASADGSEDLTM